MSYRKNNGEYGRESKHMINQACNNLQGQREKFPLPCPSQQSTNFHTTIPISIITTINHSPPTLWLAHAQKQSTCLPMQNNRETAINQKMSYSPSAHIIKQMVMCHSIWPSSSGIFIKVCISFPLSVFATITFLQCFVISLPSLSMLYKQWGRISW